MNFVFLMDPLDQVKMEKDTSFILMLGAHKRGHQVFFLADGGISQTHEKSIFHVDHVTPQRNKERPFIINAHKELHEYDVDAVFIRTDPPFDYKYLMHTWMLDRLSPHIAVINTPSGIRTANEKVWAMQFASVIPSTLLGRNKADLLTFIQREQDVIAKPTDGFGGQAVFRLAEGELNTNVILETLTHNFSRDIILQKFVPESSEGDKRILLLNGKPLGAVLRRHAADDHRNNFFSGGKPLKADITENDLMIIYQLKPHLIKSGLYFVGIDIIGDFLIEINVTSPTCLQEINRFNNKQLENDVIDFAENLVKSKQDKE